MYSETAQWNSEYRTCSCGRKWHASEGDCDCEPCDGCDRSFDFMLLSVVIEDGQELKLCASCELGCDCGGG